MRPTKEQVDDALDRHRVRCSDCAGSREMCDECLFAAEVRALREAVETALSDLECADIKCWCFTRAAMDRPACECANCKAWAVLAKVVP